MQSPERAMRSINFNSRFGSKSLDSLSFYTQIPQELFEDSINRRRHQKFLLKHKPVLNSVR